MVPKLEVGGTVTYVDSKGNQRLALVTCIWGDPDKSMPCVNLAFVSNDEARQDNFGRQIERRTSVVYKSMQPAHGSYYMMAGDVPNPVAELRS